LKLKGLTTLLFFTQYQAVVFDKKHFGLLSKIPKLSKLLSQLAKGYDTSSLCKVIIEAKDIPVVEVKTLLKPLMNLKAVFMAVQSLLAKGCQDEPVKELLDMI